MTGVKLSVFCFSRSEKLFSVAFRRISRMLFENLNEMAFGAET